MISFGGIPQFKPFTTGLCIILIIIYLIGSFLIGSPYEYIAFDRLLGIPGVISPGLIISNFAHIEIIHLLANLLFLSMIGNVIESELSGETYIGLICMSAIGVGVVNFLLGTAPVLGFSGINMALLSYYYYYYGRHTVGGPHYLQLLVGNILIGFLPGISLLGHVTGALMGLLRGLGQSRRIGK